MFNTHVEGLATMLKVFPCAVVLAALSSSASGPAALWSAQLAAFPACRPSLPLRGLFQLAAFPLCGPATLRACRFMVRPAYGNFSS